MEEHEVLKHKEGEAGLQKKFFQILHIINRKIFDDRAFLKFKSIQNIYMTLPKMSCKAEISVAMCQ